MEVKVKLTRQLLHILSLFLQTNILRTKAAASFIKEEPECLSHLPSNLITAGRCMEALCLLPPIYAPIAATDNYLHCVVYKSLEALIYLPGVQPSANELGSVELCHLLRENKDFFWSY